ncbi:uncharacterized protein LOC135145606 [Zophobas morio]|uniref:uncharacterized protein LOC135145606 n=1 Tax=Zophobas morio TaxID=2755281 RepID=UPI0030831762
MLTKASNLKTSVNPVQLYRAKYLLRKFTVLQVPILSDNYAHVLVDNKARCILAVDPADPVNVLKSVYSKYEKSFAFTSVLLTHKHSDHTAGNKYFYNHFSKLDIIGSKYEICPYATKTVGDGDVLQFGEATLRVLHVPGHTKGHLAFFVTTPSSSNPPILFSGDTLFVGGCGKIFEGTAKDMYYSLKILTNLPPETLVYCGHEYTLSNLRFALTVEPNNEKLKSKLKWTIQQLNNQRSTVPSTIGEELEYNPFLRVEEEEIKVSTGKNSPIEVLGELREMKNNFK